MTELLAVVLGAVAAYVFDIRKDAGERRQREKDAARERRRMRSSIATALILDLRGLETTLRQFYNATKPATWVGQRPSLYFDALRGEIRHFAPESIPQIDEFYRRAENLFTTIAAASPEQSQSDKFNHFGRVAAGFALQALPDAKNALVVEGGSVPEPRVLEVVDYPYLPTVPEICFPDVPAPGSQLPDELK